MTLPIAPPPDLHVTGIYYDSLVAALQRWKRIYLPDHTETDPFDLVNGLLRMVGLLQHMEHVAIDDAAAQNFLPTASTRAAFVALASLVGRQLARETPAAVDVVATITRLITSTESLVPADSRFSTTPDDGSAAVEFEWQGAALSVRPTDFAGTDGTDRGLVLRYNATAETFTAGVGALWPSAADGDAFYLGHPDAMFDSLVFDLTGTLTHDADCARWEYYDPDYVLAPSSVVDLSGGTLRHYINAFFGAQTRADGVFAVEVTYLPTGRQQTSVLQFGAGHYVETTYLGQTTPSENAALYQIRPYWVGIPEPVDGTNGMKADGTLSFTLPQTAAYNWQPTAVNGITAYWLRCRATQSPASSPTVSSVSTPRRRWHILLEDCLQGRTVTEDLGLTSGDELQSFPLAAADIIDGSAASEGSVSVDGDTEWSVVASLYGYDPDDKVVQLVEDPDGSFRYVFGDGVTGKLPASSLRVIATYRRGATADGNVGAGTVRTAATPVTALTDIRNPRAATGWAEREGATEGSRKRLALTIPGFVRGVNGPVTAEATGDYIEANFITADGRQPIARAVGYEDATDPKTARVYVVGTNGSQVAVTDRTECENWLNGTAYGWQRANKRLLMNQEASVLGWIPRTVNITVTVYVREGYTSGVQAAVIAELTRVTGPLARRRLDTDGNDATGPYLFLVGGTYSKTTPLSAVAHAAGDGFVDQTLQIDDPGNSLTNVASIDLAQGELPSAGTIAVTVVAV